jgi:hypothetical protein
LISSYATQHIYTEIEDPSVKIATSRSVQLKDGELSPLAMVESGIFFQPVVLLEDRD